MGDRYLPALALALVAGCGSPLQEATFEGEPAAVFVAVLDQIHGSSYDPGPRLRATILWSIDDDAEFVQHPGLAVPAVEGAEIRLVLFGPPPSAARTRGYALGRITAFEDTDEDGLRDADEPVRTTPDDTVVYWSPTGLTPETGPITHAIPAGYHVVVGWPPCAGPYRSSRSDEDCGTPFGAVCLYPADCGEFGDCFRITGAFNDEGVCGQFARSRNNSDCVPADTRRVPRIRGTSDIVWTWAPICESDADCEATQVCGRASGTCALRSDRIRLTLSPNEHVVDVCRDDDTRLPGPT